MSSGIPRPDLPAEKLARLVEKQQLLDGDNYDPMKHSGAIGIPYEIFLARLEVARQMKEKNTGRELHHFSLGKPWTLEGDWMIIGDVHVPFTDYEFGQLVNLVGRKHLSKPRRLLVAGDFFNMDTFSTYAHLTSIPAWKEEREAAKQLLHEWMDTFDEVKMIMGNHDRRLQKFVAGAFDETDILSLVIANPDRVQMSGFGYCTIKAGNGAEWRITHPKNYSINQLVVADTLAQKYNQHIISFHEHHLSVGFDRFKRHIIVNGGCLVQQDKLAYTSLDDTKNANMALGFVMLKSGAPYVFGKSPFTDWKFWL